MSVRNAVKWCAEIILILQGTSATIVQGFQSPQAVSLFHSLESLQKNPIVNPKKVDVMPQITVKYLMVFSQVTGKKEETLALDEGATISDLQKVLYNRYGRKFKKLIEKDFENRSVLFVVNGESKDALTVLKEGDEVLISYPVGGG